MSLTVPAGGSSAFIPIRGSSEPAPTSSHNFTRMGSTGRCWLTWIRSLPRFVRRSTRISKYGISMPSSTLTGWCSTPTKNMWKISRLLLSITMPSSTARSADWPLRYLSTTTSVITVSGAAHNRASCWDLPTRVPLNLPSACAAVRRIKTLICGNSFPKDVTTG